MRDYRYLIFDADETLLDFKKNEAHALPAVFAKYKLEFNDEIKNAYLKINQRLWRLLEQGKITTQEVMVQRFEELFDLFHIPIHPQSFSDDYMAFLSLGAYPMKDAITVLEQLSKHYHCVLVTNGFTQSQTYRLKQSGISKYMDKIVISEQVGYRKPSLQLATYLLNELQCEASECLMIGDCFETDMCFGIQAGMDTCWIRYQNDFDERKQQVTYTITNLTELVEGVLE